MHWMTHQPVKISLQNLSECLLCVCAIAAGFLCTETAVKHAQFSDLPSPLSSSVTRRPLLTLRGVRPLLAPIMQPAQIITTHLTVQPAQTSTDQLRLRLVGLGVLVKKNSFWQMAHLFWAYGSWPGQAVGCRGTSSRENLIPDRPDRPRSPRPRQPEH